MDGAAYTVAIATTISTGVSLLAGFISILVATRSGKAAAANRDAAVSTLFGIALLLIVLNVIATALVAVWGMAYVGLVKAALLPTAAFAVAGMAFGLMRGLRSGSPRPAP